MLKVIVKTDPHTREQLRAEDAAGVEFEVIGGTDKGRANQFRSSPERE